MHEDLDHNSGGSITILKNVIDLRHGVDSMI